MKVLLKLENEQTKADREKPGKLCSFCMSSTKERRSHNIQYSDASVVLKLLQPDQIHFKVWILFLNQLPCKSQR